MGIVIISKGKYLPLLHQVNGFSAVLGTGWGICFGSKDLKSDPKHMPHPEDLKNEIGFSIILGIAFFADSKLKDINQTQ